MPEPTARFGVFELPRTPRRKAQTAAAALSLAMLASPVRAHDTWLEQKAAANGRVELALSTGALFPRAETAIAAEFLLERGCRDRRGRSVALRPGRQDAHALALHAKPRAGSAIASCWVQTAEFEVEVAPALVPTYLREIGAAPDLWQAWRRQQQAGLPWRERYSKHARITLEPSTPPAPQTAAPPMAMEIEIEPPADALRAGEVLSWRVLRDGQPLAGQAVELRGDESRLGVWRRTDADGRASVTLPWAGRWVLRATDLRADARPGHWTSRFVTHAFAVGPARAGSAPHAQVASSESPNARSANHTSASAAIASEPPTSTAWR